MLQKPNIIWWVPWLVRVLRLFRFGKDLLLSGYTSDIQKTFFHSSSYDCLFDNEIIKHGTHSTVVMVT